MVAALTFSTLLKVISFIFRYQKRKYNEIIAAKQKKQFKHPNVLRKKKTKKSAGKK